MFMFDQHQNVGENIWQVRSIQASAPSDLGCCLFYGDESVVIDSLFVVFPIVCRGRCNQKISAQYENQASDVCKA